MKRLTLVFSVVLVCALMIRAACFAQGQEQITITTYYPSPFGSYNELTVSERMAIGDLNDDGTVDVNDLADAMGGSLVISETLGVGTRQPQQALHVKADVPDGFGGIVIENAAVATTARASLTFRDCTSDRSVIYQEGQDCTIEPGDLVIENFASGGQTGIRLQSEGGFLTLDAGGDVGIGLADRLIPAKFVVSVDGASHDLIVDSNNGNVGIGGDPGIGKFVVSVDGASHDLIVDSNNGNVGIGGDPDPGTAKLSISGGNVALNNNWLTYDNTPDKGILIKPDHRVCINTSEPSAIQFTSLTVNGIGEGNVQNVTPLGYLYYFGDGGILYDDEILPPVSSERFKKDIAPFQDDFAKILKVSPKSFVFKKSGKPGIGYIAEDFDQAGLRDLVHYDKEGKPYGVKYDKICVYLLEVVKEQDKEIQDLRAEIEKTSLALERIEARLDSGRDYGLFSRR